MICTRTWLVFGLFWAALLSVWPSFAQTEARVRRNLEIDWDPIEGATGYEIKVFKTDKKNKPMKFKVTESHWSALIPSGTYLMQMRSFDDRGAPGEWSPPSELTVHLPAIIVKTPAPTSTVNSDHESKFTVQFSWEPVPGARKYKLTLKSADGSTNKEKFVETPSLELELPVAQAYSWNVRAIDENNDEGDVSSEPYTFQLAGPRLSGVKIKRPRSKFVQELSWHEVNKAETYDFEWRYLNPTTKAWEVVEKKAGLRDRSVELDFKRPSGRYRAVVQAHAPYRESSPATYIDFPFKGGFKSKEELERNILRDSLYLPTHFYAIASYLVTQISYRGANRDANSAPSFTALGGTGRIGAGYHNPDSPWGGFGIVDLSGFTIERQNFQFASLEGHATHKLEFGQQGILLLGGGLFLKELPSLSGSSLDGFKSVSKLRMIGPHAGFTYWVPFNATLGLQLNARTYFTLMGSATGGRKAETSMSYQYGAMGSYRLGLRWMGYAGYAFRKDLGRFATNPSDPDSFARQGDSNEVAIEGHYLNLILEYSF